MLHFAHNGTCYCPARAFNITVRNVCMVWVAVNSHMNITAAAYIVKCVYMCILFLNCLVGNVSFTRILPFNVFTSYLIILPHRKRHTFICIFLVNIHTPSVKRLNGVHNAMNLELCSLTQSLAHAPIFLPFVCMPIYLYVSFSRSAFLLLFIFEFSFIFCFFFFFFTFAPKTFTQNNFPLVER